MNYISKARKGLNQWAENHLPGDKLWSTPLGESYTVFKEAYPIYKFFPPAVTATYAGTVSYAFTHPGEGMPADIVVWGIATIMAWTSAVKPKLFYDILDKEYRSGTVLIPEGAMPKKYRKVYDFWLKRNGLEDVYEAAKAFSAIAGRKPMFG